MANNIMANTTGTHLNDLNDDCLLEIFSSNSLTPMDLLSLAETCKRFKGIAQRSFPKQFGIVEQYLSRSYQISSKNGLDFVLVVQDVKRILKNFGSTLSSLTIQSEDHSIVDCIAKNCGPKLQHLEIAYFLSIESLVEKFKSIFQNLSKLKFHDCHFNIDPASLKLNCSSLVELNIEISSCCEILFKQSFPQLKRFAFCKSSAQKLRMTNDYCPEIMFEFVARHQLKSLHFECFHPVRDDLIHKINDSCKELEELKLVLFKKDNLAIDISKLQNLAKLKILDFDRGPFTLATLKNFHQSNSRCDDGVPNRRAN